MVKKLLVLLFLSANTYCQTLCNNGFAGIYSCQNIDLMANLDFPAIGGNNNTEGNDVWGWVDPLTNKEYALMGCTSHLAFVDVTNPANPIYLGKVNSHNNVTSLWRDIEVYNNHVFIVSEAPGHGMQVFDLTRLRNITTPQDFLPDARYAGFGNCHTISINTQSGFAYCLGSNTFSGGPHVLNIQNPTNPVFVGGYAAQGYTHDGQVITYTNGPDAEHNGKEILMACNEDNLVILDYTNKQTPQLLAIFEYANTAYTHQGWFTEDLSYFIMGDELDETEFGFNSRTIIVNVSDLDNPEFSFDYFGPTPAIDHNGYVVGNDFHMANYRAGYRLIDVSNIENQDIEQIGFFDTFPSSNSAQFNGAWNVYPFLPSGIILISDIDRGLFILKKNNLLQTLDLEKKQPIAVLPNPASDIVNVSSKNQSIEKIEIFNILGKKIKEVEVSNLSDVSLDISSLDSGLYLLKVNNSTTKKIIKR